MPSLQDQLLKAGLVDKKQVKQVNKEKRKQTNVARRSSEEVVDEVKQQAEQARLEKVQRDRELNRQRDQELVGLLGRGRAADQPAETPWGNPVGVEANALEVDKPVHVGRGRVTHRHCSRQPRADRLAFHGRRSEGFFGKNQVVLAGITRAFK
mgnify:CR=1 FL=1